MVHSYSCKLIQSSFISDLVSDWCYIVGHDYFLRQNRGRDNGLTRIFTFCDGYLGDIILKIIVVEISITYYFGGYFFYDFFTQNIRWDGY